MSIPLQPDGDLYEEFAPPDLVEAVRRFANTVEWTTAKTDKSIPPHQYILDWEGQNSARRQGMRVGYERMTHFIDDYGVVRRWHGSNFRSCDLLLDDGVVWSFWLMNDFTIINRKPMEHAGWDPNWP